MRTVPQPRLPHFEHNTIDQAVALDGEKHYRLVHPDELTVEELKSYRERLEG